MAELVCIDCGKTYDPQQGHFCLNECWIPRIAMRNTTLQQVEDALSSSEQEHTSVNNDETRELTSFYPELLNINSDINFQPQRFSNTQHALSNPVETSGHSESVAECSTDESFAIAGPSHLQFRDTKCVICFNEFSDEDHLSIHVESHKEEWGFTCNICQKVIKHYDSLKCHMNGHAGIRPYECEYCEATFTQERTWKRHTLSHTNPKTFSCNICGRNFTTNKILSDHMLTHSSDNPYKCEICGHNSSTKSNLKMHMRMHDQEEENLEIDV